MSDEWNQNPEQGGSPNDEREISLLEAFDRAVAPPAAGQFCPRPADRAPGRDRRAGRDGGRRARDDREARAGDQEGDLAGESHRHFSRQPGARHRADRRRRRGLLLQRRSADQPGEAAEGNARSGQRSLRHRRRSRF